MLPFVRGALAQTPVRTVVVTGEAHILDFAARLEGLEDTDVDLADRRLHTELDLETDLAHPACTGARPG